jgi:luciferase family oxidoreductase group 1
MSALPPLSVLDLFPVVSGTAPSRALHDSVRLAQRVDELGYTRYWIAEHHNMPGIASAAPEVLIAHVAQATRRIRVGSGGIMIPNHTPLRVVEIFRTLEALHPGRIDLGLGRAPGTDPLTASALQRGSSEVNQALAEILAFSEGFPDDHPYRAILAMPSDTPLPPIWMLGSTQAGAAIAAALGTGYAFAGHFSMGEAAGAMRRYRETFQRKDGPPRAILALSVICAESDARAEELALPLRVAYTRIGRGRPGVFPTLEEARAHRFTAEDHAIVERFAAGMIVGGPDRVRDQMLRFANDLGADELMVSTVVPDPEERIKSYERLAELFALPR